MVIFQEINLFIAVQMSRKPINYKGSGAENSGAPLPNSPEKSKCKSRMALENYMISTRLTPEVTAEAVDKYAEDQRHFMDDTNVNGIFVSNS